MKTNYILIDYENVQVKSLALLKGGHFRVKVFLGPTNTKLPIELVLAMQELGERAEYIVLEAHGRNALDFHIAYYLGVLSASEPDGFFHVISKDTGFDPLLQHLKTRKILSYRSASIEEMPCFTPISANVTLSNGHSIEDKVPTEIDNLVAVAVDDLIKRKASKPRTSKTLRSTIHAKLGKNVPSMLVDTVYDALVTRSYVKVDGEKVTYALPSA
ncbi:MAG: PIN domain-containing protein [Methylococcaceae bacterium]|nr:PIN domain-containing protein [Methylococcaceae bacterium]